MAITHGTATRGRLAQQVLADVDLGSAAAHLVILTSGNTTLADVTLQDPAFTRSGAVITLAGVPLSDNSADAGGTASKFEVRDSDGNVVFTGSAGTSGTDMIVDSTAFTAGQKFTINSMTYTAPL